MLCQFLLYSKVNQLYIYMYPLFFRFYSHIGHYRVLSRVPSAIQQILISYLFYIQQCVYVNPLEVFYYLFLFIYLFIYLFLAVLGLCFCARAFSSSGKLGPLLIVVRGPLTVVTSPAAEHNLQTRRLSSCGSWAQLLHGMWDLPRPGLEPVSPALAARLPTTAPPGKSSFLKKFF